MYGIKRVIATVVAAVPSMAAVAQSGGWRIIDPANTGIPGEEVRFLRFDPHGMLQVGARWPFWGDGGIGIYDFGTQIWTTDSKGETPIPSEFVNDIEFGPGDVVWIATDGGLVRRQGNAWTIYTTANAPLLHDGIRNIDLDSEGHVWMNNSHVQQADGAIFRFDGTNWRRFRVGQELPWAPPWYPLSDVLVAHDDHVWVANDTLNGLAQFDGQQWTLHGASVDRFKVLVEDLDGNIWARGGVGGYNAFYKYDHAVFTKFPIPTTPLSIAVDQDGAVYTGDWHGNVRKTTDGGQSWTYFLTGLNSVFNIEPDPFSTDIWIGTQGAVGHFQADGSWVRDYNTYNTGLPWYWVERFDLDSAGNFWVATGEAGLSRFDGARWRNWGAHNAGSEPYPWAGNEPMGGFYLARDGVGWMGGNGIGRWDPPTGQFTGFWNWQNNPGMGTSLFTAFAEDAAGTVFATQQGPVFRFNGNLWETVPGVSGSAGLEADSHGNVWALAGGRLARWDGQSWTSVGPPLLGLDSFTITPDDVFWLGMGPRIGRWDGFQLDLYDATNSPMTAGLVMGIDSRLDGAIGVSVTGDTLSTQDSASITINGDPDLPENWSVHRYGQAPLPHWQVTDTAFDAQGDLWISCWSQGAAALDSCTSAGSVKLARELYACDGTVDVSIVDCDLNGDPDVVDTFVVVVTSTSEPGGEQVLLTEIHPDSGVFTGSIPLAPQNVVGVLWVSHGDTVAATYIDFDDGQGGFNVVHTVTALVDCEPPQILGVQTDQIKSSSARISLVVDEPVLATVLYGTDCASLDHEIEILTPSAAPVFDLTGLAPNTTCHFAVQARDAVGNAVYDDNGGGCYAFTTMPRPRKVYGFTLDTDPGWSVEGQWAWGQPTGGGSYNHDPTSGYTGPNVYGYNLAGDYPNNLPEQYLTTPALDCRWMSEVRLQFRRWLGVQHPNWDHADLRLSTDGANWVKLWQNPTQITDTSWALMEFDLSAYADHQPTVYLRWTMGPTNSSYTFCGWNIDDIEIWGVTPGLNATAAPGRPAAVPKK